MIIAHNDFENNIKFGESNFYSLIIENENNFYKIVSSIIKQNLGEEEGFVLTENFKNLNFENNVEVITGPFGFSVNSKKIQNLIYKKLMLYSQEDESLKDFALLQKYLTNFVQRLCEKVDLPLEIDLPDKDNIIKSVPVKIEESSDFYDNLREYINCLLELTKVRLVILIDCNKMFNKETFEDFEKLVAYSELKVLFIDHSEVEGEPFINLPTLIIDRDYCEILKVDTGNLF